MSCRSRPPYPRRAITLGTDGTARFWDLERGRGAGTLRGAHRVTIAADGLRALIAVEHEVGIWNLEQPGIDWQSDANTGRVASLAIGGQAGSGAEDGTVRLWDPETGRCLSTARSGRARLEGSRDRLWAEGRSRAIGSVDAQLRLVELGTGESLAVLEEDAEQVVWVAAEERWGAYGTADARTCLWDLEGGVQSAILSKHGPLHWSNGPSGSPTRRAPTRPPPSACDATTRR